MTQTAGLLQLAEYEEGDRRQRPDTNSLRDDYDASSLVEVSFEADTYSWLMIMFVRFCDPPSSQGQQYYLALLHALLMYCISIAMEVVVAGFLLLSAERAERGMEDLYFIKHYNISIYEASLKLQLAVASQKPLAQHFTGHIQDIYYDPATQNILAKCAEQIANVESQVFYYVMILFWIMFMLAELKSTAWWFLHICGVRVRNPAHPNQDLVKCSPRDHLTGAEKVTIVQLDAWMRVTMILFIPIVRGMIAMILTYVGMKFLILQVDQAILVMKVLCMNFVIQIDELMMKSLVTSAAMQELRDAKFQTYLGRPKRQSLWNYGVGGMFYMAVALSILFFVTHGIFGNLMHFRYSCVMYHGSFNIQGLRPVASWTDVITEIFS